MAGSNGWPWIATVDGWTLNAWTNLLILNLLDASPVVERVDGSGRAHIKDLAH